MSLLAGLSTTLGAGAVLLLPGRRVSRSQMAFALALAAGVMLSVTVLEFWLPLLADGGRAGPVLLFSAVGAGGFLLLALFVPEPQVEKSLEGGDGEESEEQGRRCRLALVLMLALTAHNFPEGFAVAISAMQSQHLGLVVMFAIAVHNVPEGISIALPVLAASGSRWKALWMSFLSGMAEPLGAATALLMVHGLGGTLSEDSMENLLCTVGGVMCAVAVKELLPEAYRQKRPTAASLGLAAGCAIMCITDLLGA